MRTLTLRALALAVPLFSAAPALAHGGHAEGFAAGLAHPLLGVDHLLAMLAIGIWAGIGGMARAWVVPAGFLGGMAAGIGLGLILALPGGIEHGIAATVLALGLALALALPARAAIALPVAVVFGLLHGSVHGAEIGGAAGATSFGMLAASAALLALGVLIGRVATARIFLARAGGTGIACAGLALLIAG